LKDLKARGVLAPQIDDWEWPPEAYSAMLMHPGVAAGQNTGAAQRFLPNDAPDRCR
jgi:hypothetical protein